LSEKADAYYRAVTGKARSRGSNVWDHCRRRSGALWQRPVFDDQVVGVVLHAGDEEDASSGQPLKPGIVVLAAIKDQDGARRKAPLCTPPHRNRREELTSRLGRKCRILWTRLRLLWRSSS